MPRQKRKRTSTNRLKLDPEVKCYLPGVPRATYMPYPFQIVHSAEAIFFAYEYAGAVRNIYMKDPGPAPVESWMGQSVGHWEGDTLVVDVTGSMSRTWFDRAGNFHSDELHVVERYTLESPDTSSSTRPPSRTPRRFRGRGKSACRSTVTWKRMPA